jgi:hypothetical protein
MKSHPFILQIKAFQHHVESLGMVRPDCVLGTQYSNHGLIFLRFWALVLEIGG